MRALFTSLLLLVSASVDNDLLAAFQAENGGVPQNVQQQVVRVKNDVQTAYVRALKVLRAQLTTLRNQQESMRHEHAPRLEAHSKGANKRSMAKSEKVRKSSAPPTMDKPVHRWKTNPTTGRNDVRKEPLKANNHRGATRCEVTIKSKFLVAGCTKVNTQKGK
jgi:hypothetical protein